MLTPLLKGVTRLHNRVLLIPILTVILGLSGCMVSPEGRVYRREPRPEPRPEPSQEPHPVRASEIEGLWFLNAGNATGRLEFFRVRGILTGRIWFDAYRRWEELTDLYIDSRTGHLHFTRPGAAEHYSGTLIRNQMTGEYRARGLTYRWEARRETESAALPRIDGLWTLYAGNASGRLEFSWVRRALTGRIWFDAYQRWEELVDLSFDPEAGHIAFYRPEANEWYRGTVSGSRISGTYTVTLRYPWEGRRETRPTRSSEIDGLWIINAGNASGRLELYWSRNTLAGRIWFDVYGRWEELTDLSYDRREGRLEFTRPHGRSERYSGRLSGDRVSGTYSVKGPDYLWEARR